MLPLYAQIAIDRLAADASLRTPAKLDELIEAYRGTYGLPSNPSERDRAHAEARRRFFDFAPA